MITTVWSVKGGAGASVVAAALAVLRAESRDDAAGPADGPVELVDLCGDLPAVLGVARPSGPGVRDWLQGPAPDPAALHRLSVPVVEGLRLVPAGEGAPVTDVGPLEQALSDRAADVVVDAGVLGGRCGADWEPFGRSLLVVRPCYLALRAAVALQRRPDAAVVVEEPGRALVARDVGDVLGVPVVATVPLDPAVARAVDAGVLCRRVPRSLVDALRHLG